MNKTKLKAWIAAMRLRTLPLSFSVIITGNALAYGYMGALCKWQCDFSWSILSLTLLTTLLLQVLSNLANDYGDAKKGTDNEHRIGPERAIQSGLISLEEMKKAVIICSIITFIAGITLLFFVFQKSISLPFFSLLALGLLAIAAAIKYTVGKKAYGYHAMGDLFVFIFFGFLGVGGSFFLQTHMIIDNSEIWPVAIFSLMMGALCTAVLNLNNMRDHVNDAAAGKNTLVVKMGLTKAKIYHYILFIIFWLPLIVASIVAITKGIYKFLGDPAVILTFLLLIWHLIHLKKVYRVKDPRDFDPELKKIAISSFLFSIFLFSTYLL